MKYKLTYRKALQILISVGLLSIALFAFTEEVSAQCQPFIKVDGKIMIANETVASGVKFPMWLKAGQTVACGLSVASISGIEFSENGTSLEYSQVISLTSQTPVQVPAGKVWKIESILKNPIISGGTNKVEFLMDGTSTFTVPSCAEYICIECWGGGGGGRATSSSSPYTNGTGGGGGAYGQGCFSVTPGASYTVTVGAGGAGGTTSNASGSAGGTSSVGALISAGGGSGGSSSVGAGGTSTASINVPGFSGKTGVYYPGSTSYGYGGYGGYGANGGAGGIGLLGANGSSGTAPGGGGSGGGANGSSVYTGGSGAPGRVIIYW